MTKTFIYNVNGTTFEDTKAFGEAWKAAAAMAKEEHAIITRQVINGNDIRNEYYAKGIFLNERFMNDTKAYIF